MGLLLSRYLTSNFRRIGVDELRRELNQVDRKRRRRIRRAIGRGAAVDDPRDAQLALKMVEQSKAIIIGAFAVTRGPLSGFLATLSIVALMGWLLARILRGRQARRLEAAYAANARLAQAFEG